MEVSLIRLYQASALLRNMSDIAKIFIKIAYIRASVVQVKMPLSKVTEFAKAITDFERSQISREHLDAYFFKIKKQPSRHQVIKFPQNQALMNREANGVSPSEPFPTGHC